METTKTIPEHQEIKEICGIAFKKYEDVSGTTKEGYVYFFNGIVKKAAWTDFWSLCTAEEKAGFMAVMMKLICVADEVTEGQISGAF